MRVARRRATPTQTARLEGGPHARMAAEPVDHHRQPVAVRTLRDHRHPRAGGGARWGTCSSEHEQVALLLHAHDGGLPRALGGVPSAPSARTPLPLRERLPRPLPRRRRLRARSARETRRPHRRAARGRAAQRRLAPDLHRLGHAQLRHLPQRAAKRPSTSSSSTASARGTSVSARPASWRTTTSGRWTASPSTCPSRATPWTPLNLATADTGLIETANERARALGVEVGRIDIALPRDEEHAGPHGERVRDAPHAARPP